MAQTLIAPTVPTPKNWEEVEQAFGTLQAYYQTLNDAHTLFAAQNPSLVLKDFPTALVHAIRGTFFGQPRTFVKINANQSIADSTETAVSWSEPAADAGVQKNPDSGWNLGQMWTAGVPTKFFIKVNGLYLLNWGVRFAGNATGVRYTFATIGGTGATADLAQSRHAAAAVDTSAHQSLILPLVYGNTVTINVFQSSGGPLDIVSGFLNTWCQVTKIG